VKKRSEKTLKAILDKVFSIYIRTKYSVAGFNICYCGKRIPIEESDASHYVPRGCLNLRYDERNVYPSCRRCNRYMDGNLPAYAVFLEKTHGQGILQQLLKDKEVIVKYFPYEEKIEYYKKRIAELV